MALKVISKRLLLAVGLAQASAAFAATAPFSENFNSATVGDVPVANFTESTSTSYTVVAGSIAGDNKYQAVISSTANGINASSGVQIPGLAGNSFSVSSEFTLSAFSVPSTSTVNLGFGVLGSDPNFSNGTQYRILFTVGSAIAGEAGTINIQENGTTFVSQTRGSSIGVSLDVPYSLTLTATYSGGAVTLVATAKRLDTGATTVTSVTDTTPQSGSYFGYRTAVNAVGGTASETVLYDNFAVIPEPASGTLLLASAGLIGTARRRSRLARF